VQFKTDPRSRQLRYAALLAVGLSLVLLGVPGPASGQGRDKRAVTPISAPADGARLGGVQDYVKLVTTAKDALSGVYSIGKFAYDIFSWAQGKEDREGQIWDAVQRMEKQLDAIQASLNHIQAQIDRGFERIHDAIDVSTYNAMVLPLKRLAGTVAAAEDDLQDLIENATSATFSAKTAAEKTDSIKKYIDEIIPQFKSVDDVFRDSILKGRLFTTPTYSFAAKALLVGSAHFMTPADSEQLENFASFMLQYQALAFNLIVRWETRAGSVSTTLKNAIKLYLGFDSPAEAKLWLDSATTTAPSEGDLQDELSYLAKIRPVPAHAIVDSYDTDESKGTGMMWSYEPLKGIRFDLRDYVRYPPGTWCGGNYQAISSDFCPYMSDDWGALKRALGDYEADFGQHTGLGAWEAATPSQAEAVITRVGRIADAGLRSYYWTPVDAAFVKRQYQQSCGGGGPCSVCPENTYCGYRGALIDGVTVKTIEASGKMESCTFGVGDGRGTYFPDSSHRADCPLLSPLIGRKPARDERYWPQLPAS
jgi:hypothetical protein